MIIRIDASSLIPFDGLDGRPKTEDRRELHRSKGQDSGSFNG
ncbi:hypothetical protein [Litoribacter ruber]|nr:hypothetical protein [Litoribacter ruber]